MEIKEARAKRFCDYGDALKALQGHFRAASIEKHPDAMLKLFFSEAGEKYLQNYRKFKISKSVEEKIRLFVLDKLRRFYGEWANLYDFNLKKYKFHTNFQSIYKTENGRLYGSYPGTMHDHVFYTSHCFEQFKARSFCFDIYEMPIRAFKKVRNVDPTAADILKFLILNAEESCTKGNFLYLNVRIGVVVFERLSGCLMIAKTFLAPEMDFPRSGWVFNIFTGFGLDPTNRSSYYHENLSIKPIKEPTFSGDDMLFSDCKKAMLRQTECHYFDI